MHTFIRRGGWLLIALSCYITSFSLVSYSYAEVTYNPPDVGAPTRRAGAGTRGAGDADLAKLYVIAPEHTGLVATAQPTLYWVTSKVPQQAIELRLIKVFPESLEDADPLLEVKQTVDRAGLHSLDLAKHEIKLDENTEYEWSVSLAGKQATFSSATIRYQVPQKTVTEKVTPKPRLDAYIIYAAAGFWYDAIAALSAAMRQQPNNKTLMADQTSLFKQATLEDVSSVLSQTNK